MSLPEELAGFSREELIEPGWSALWSYPSSGSPDRRLRSRPTKAATRCREGAEAAVLGQGQPARPLQGRTAEAAPRLCPATRRAHPPGGTRHGQLPRLPGSSDRREGARKPPGDYPAPGTGAGNRTRGARTRLPQVPEKVGARTGLGRLERGPPTVRRFGAE